MAHNGGKGNYAGMTDPTIEEPQDAELLPVDSGIEPVQERERSSIADSAGPSRQLVTGESNILPVLATIAEDRPRFLGGPAGALFQGWVADLESQRNATRAELRDVQVENSRLKTGFAKSNEDLAVCREQLATEKRQAKPRIILFGLGAMFLPVAVEQFAHEHIGGGIAALLVAAIIIACTFWLLPRAQT
jgi:hypothetical protein